MIEFLFFSVHVVLPLLLIVWLFWQPHRSRVELTLHLASSRLHGLGDSLHLPLGSVADRR